jgi:hypothetical protein
MTEGRESAAICGPPALLPPMDGLFQQIYMLKFNERGLMLMFKNRSMPESGVIPVLIYSDVNQAVDWPPGIRLSSAAAYWGSSRAVNDWRRSDRRYSRKARFRKKRQFHHGASGQRQRALCACHETWGRLLSAVADYPYGERQYSVEDMEGHRWTFSQTIADIDPKDWGGMPGESVMSSSIAG